MNGIPLPVKINTFRLTGPKLDVVYPAVEGLPHWTVQQKINSRILHETQSLIHQQGYPQNPTAEVTGSYEIKTNERGIVSLLLINYAYESGAAHGLTVNRSLTIDITDGKSFAFAQLFNANAPYVKTLSDLIERQIRERDVQLLDEFKGIRADQDFYVADKALVVYFQLYEITPYAFGFPYFPISIYEIQDIVDEQGPLGKMMF